MHSGCPNPLPMKLAKALEAKLAPLPNDQTPAPRVPCVVPRPLVALAREVDPLWVPKLVAHEVEVGLPAQRHGHQADELVEGHATGNDCRGRALQGRNGRAALIRNLL